MKKAEVVQLLKEKGITLTESGVKYLAKKYDLYNPRTGSARSGLDPIKVQALVETYSSPVRVRTLAGDLGVNYSKLYYTLMKYSIPTEKRFGVLILKNKEDLEYVKNVLRRISESKGIHPNRIVIAGPCGRGRSRSGLTLREDGECSRG